jgi:hypothetical protein
VRLTPGQRLGPYEVLSVLGAGGMAEVYRARDTRLQREVALKVVNEALAADPELVKRFEQEARVAGSLNHPNLVAVYDVGVQDDAPFFVTELLQGESLRQRLSRGRIPQGTALRWAVQMAQGLAAAHARGIIHRDVKPENAFVTSDGQVKLLDFGIAKLAERRGLDGGGGHGLLEVTVTPTGDSTRTGAVLGSPGYMSPEQVRGESVDARTDLFSLGSVLYEMLAGQRAFPGSLVESGYAILHEDPAPLEPEVGAPLARVVSRCLEKEPERRFQTARDLGFALEVLSGGSGPQALPGKIAPPLGRRRRLWIALAAVLGLGLLAAGAAWKLRSPAEARLARVEQITFREGTILSARFTPEGRVLLSGSWEGEPPGLYAHTPGSAETAALGLPNACLLGVSRGGELALSLKPRTYVRDECQGTLARAPGTGSAPRELMERVTYADWAPSGQLAVVYGASGEKQRLEYPIGKTLFETGGWITHPRVSPSGDVVAFIHHPTLPDDSGTVMLVDTAGKARTLTKQWPRAEGLAWSPKGTEIWFTAGLLGRNVIWAVTPEGTLREVFQNVSDLRLEDIAPDGTLLVSQQIWRQDIFFVESGKPGERRLSWYDWASLAEISPDGTWIAFTQAAPVQTSSGLTPSLTLVRKTDGSAAQILGDGYALAISPDGKWVASGAPDYLEGVVVHPVGTGSSYRVNTPGLEIQRVRWLHDGKRMVATGKPIEEALYRLYLIDPGGAPPRAISDPGILPFLIDISPDDRWVAAVGPTRATTLYPIAGGPAITLTDLPEMYPTGWSPEGQLWVKDRDKIPTRLVRYDVQRRKVLQEQLVAPADTSGVVTIPRIRLSSDGKAMAYDFRRMLDYLYLMKGLGAEKH